MTDAAEAWSQVGERFASWGRKVAAHYQEAGLAGSADGQESEARRVAREAVDEVGRAVSAFGKTVRDEQANRELSDAVSVLGGAITATVQQAASAIRSGGSKDRGEGDPAGAGRSS